VTSVATNGQCVELYVNTECSGQRIELNPAGEFYPNLRELNFSDKVSSVRRCAGGRACRKSGPNLVTSTRTNSQTPLLGQYMPDKNRVVIKTGSVPPIDYFCELTRRCTGNRNFDCNALKHEARCYCESSRRVTCDSGTFYQLNHKDFQEETNNRFPLPGEFRDRDVYHMSSSYETPFIQSCELALRCSKNKKKCQKEEYGVGGQGFQTGCRVDDRSDFAVAPAGSGIKARQPAVVEEDDDFGSLQ